VPSGWTPARTASLLCVADDSPTGGAEIDLLEIRAIAEKNMPSIRDCDPGPPGSDPKLSLLGPVYIPI